MSLTKLSSLLRGALHLSKRENSGGRANRTGNPASSLPPSSSLPPHSSPSAIHFTFTEAVFPTTPVEVLERILSYLFVPSQDPLISTSFPPPPRPPLALLLVSKGFYHLVLPYFYRSIKILRSRDWITLFNDQDGILGARELGMGRASIEDRRSWVEECFCRQGEGQGFVWIPWDHQSNKWAQLPKPSVFHLDPSLLLLPNLRQEPSLPNLRCLFVLPVDPPSASSPSEVDRLADLLWNGNRTLGRSVSTRKNVNKRNVLRKQALLIGELMQEEAVSSLGLASLHAYVHHPLRTKQIQKPFRYSWDPSNTKATWIVDASGWKEEDIVETFHDVRSVLDVVPWNQRSVLWIGVRGMMARKVIHTFVSRMDQAGYCKGWEIVEEDGSTRRFLGDQDQSPQFVLTPLCRF
ncbi:hypothetical protein BDY24DRAFT_397399 [Mrakia frigida]|uniref:uncharacterized protein n=1 Tax=Mrakia frigida TaxID=29902 RepID=UPI003FCC0904